MWSIKLNAARDIYTLRLTLERLPGQKPMEELMRIPRPSQLDDWLLYEQLERKRIRQTEGQLKLDDWTKGRADERIEREQWRHSREFSKLLAAKDKESERAEAGGGHHSWGSWTGSSTGGRRKWSDIDTDLLPPPEVDEEQEAL